MHRILILLYLALLAIARAEPVTPSDSTYVVYRVDLKKNHLALYWKDDTGARLGSFRRLKDFAESRGAKLEFAMNAGIFSPEFIPMGLHVANGQELVPLNLQDGTGNFFLKPNGVFLIEKSVASIVEASAYPTLNTHPSLAVQSGPLLVSKGQLHPAFRPDSQNRYIRNGVGIDSKGQVILVISKTPVTLHEFATFFKESLHCNNALYLDGAISRYYFPALGSDFLEGDFAGILAITTP